MSPDDPLLRQLADRIGEIYAVEAEAGAANATSVARLALRRERSRPLMDALKKRLVEVRAGSLPKSVLGRACAYALGQWTRLEVFMENGQIEADNNSIYAVRGLIGPKTL